MSTSSNLDGLLKQVYSDKNMCSCPKDKCSCKKPSAQYSDEIRKKVLKDMIKNGQK